MENRLNKEMMLLLRRHLKGALSTIEKELENKAKKEATQGISDVCSCEICKLKKIKDRLRI